MEGLCVYGIRTEKRGGTREKEVLAGRSRAPGRTTAQLLVDRDDSFFFDHTLDHVPGILVVAGLADLVREESEGLRPDRRVKLSLDFHRFCGLDDDITLAVSPLPSGAENEAGWELRAEIGPDVACSGTAVLHQKSSMRFLPAAPVPAGDSLPAAGLAHRTRPENCLIATAWWHDDRLLARAQRPPLDHLLWDRPLEQLIEAARQFATLIGHAGYEKPIDSKFILRTLEADLPLTPPPGDVYLEWTRRPVNGRAFDLTMRLYRPTGDGFDEEVGSANFDTLIVNPRQYQTIRFREHRARERAL
ncbi:AfsA-related hotdog domain-containing protein [Streptomyces sp. NPDC002088]|uniref:AfsA-related hotdog domain-containing protein n=1 Tax=Streptomyces sp. NPDC002088 TaxID=3154665 RepID=UPI0033315BFA